MTAQVYPIANEARKEQFLDKSLPSNEDAERIVLGSVLLDNDVMPSVAEVLAPEDFYSPLHRRIYSAMLQLFQAAKKIDPIMIGEELKKEGPLESLGGISVITNLSHGVPFMQNVDEYIQIIADKATMRRIIRTCNSLSYMVLAEELEPQETIDTVEKSIFEVCERPNERDKAEPFGVLAHEALLKRKTAIESGVSMLGLPTGFRDLDDMTGGLHRTDLTIVAARPSMGKTAYVTQQVVNAAKSGAVVAFFSLEMSKEQIIDRILCAEAHVDLFRYKKNYIVQAEWDRISEALNVLNGTRLFIDDTAAMTPMQVLAKCRRIAAENKGLDLVAVDYLQLMATAKRTENRQQEVSQISRELKGVAKQLNVPLIALSQLSRAPEARQDKRPIMSDLRDSGSIEQDADVVQFLYRDDYYDKNSPVPGTAELIIAKQRNGPTGTAKFAFLKQYTRFEAFYEG